jgi:hypothetical protein
VAIEQYITHARLTGKEREFLEIYHTPEEAFNLTTLGWEKNINKKRWRGHEKAKNMLSQVLGVFDLLNAAACSVRFRFGMTYKIGISALFCRLWCDQIATSG